MLTYAVNYLLNLAGNRSQVTILYVRVDVEHRLDIVMADDNWCSRSLDRREITQQLRLRNVSTGEAIFWALVARVVWCWSRRTAACCNRCVQYIRDVVDLILGGLNGNAIADPVLWIQPIIRCRLAAAAE